MSAVGSAPGEAVATSMPQAVVNWQAAVAAVEALGHSAGEKALPLLEPMTRELLAPLCRIEELAAFGARALAGDHRALRDLQDLARQVVQSRPSSAGLYRTFIQSDASRNEGAGGCCGPRDPVGVGAPSAVLSAEDVLSEPTLVELVLTIVGVAAANRGFARNETLDAFAIALLDAYPIVQAALALRNAGIAGVVAHIRALVTTNRLMSFSPAAADSLWDFDVDPPLDIDRGHGWPPGLKPVPDIIAELRKPIGLDGDYWVPFTPFDSEPVLDYPPGFLALLGCLRQVGALIDARAAIPPPSAPPRAVWTDGITGVEQAGFCAGDDLVIQGSGFETIRDTAVVLLPLYGGCHPVDVPAADWTDTAITVKLPAGTFSGPVGFADANYADAYRNWTAEQDRLADELSAYPCYLLAGPISVAPPFPTCPPDLVFNRVRAGAPVIKAFTLNGLSPLFAEPGTALQLDWTVENAETIRLDRNGSVGPGFGGAPSVTNPPGQSYVLGAVTGDTPVAASYTLTATGPCGTAIQTVEARLRKIPTLRIIGVEVTQGIQRFRSPGGADNSIAVVAAKDTAVRVYVAADNLNGFRPGFGSPDQIAVKGSLQVDGYWLSPTNTAIAQTEGPRLRAGTNNSLNFKIPAALATGTQTLRVHAWTADEIEAPPTGAGTRPTSPFHNHVVTWINKRPFKVRYVRVSTPSSPALSDADAREAVVRAFDLLPTPVSDIAPARRPTWHTGQNINTREGLTALLGHIDDQHDCTLSEALFPWEDECPDDDGAVWLAITAITGWGGLTEPWQAFDTSRNTVVTSTDRLITVHELGHTLELKHVRVGIHPEDQVDFDDTLPDGGAIRAEDAFDVHKMAMVMESMSGLGVLFDFMAGAGVFKWVSPTNWERLLNKF